MHQSLRDDIDAAAVTAAVTAAFGQACWRPPVITRVQPAEGAAGLA